MTRARAARGYSDRSVDPVEVKLGPACEFECAMSWVDAIGPFSDKDDVGPIATKGNKPEDILGDLEVIV